VEAARCFGESLTIRKKLAAIDSTNTEWQRGLAISYAKLADLSELQNKAAKAKGYWKQAFEVLSGIEKRGLHLSPEDRQHLEILRRKAGVAVP